MAQRPSRRGDRRHYPPGAGPGALRPPRRQAGLVDATSGRTLSYRQLAGGVERVAAGLAARGFAKGDTLALFSPNLPEYALAAYGAMAAGGTVTGANPLLTTEELAGQLADADARLLITVPPFLDRALVAADKAGVQEVLVFGEADGATPFRELLTHTSPPAQIAIDPDRDAAALPYSSGTTGLPKGVELTHTQLVTNLRQAQAVLGVREDDVVLAVAPFFHAMGFNILLACSLAAGATTVTMPRFELEGFLQAIQEHRATFTIVVPPVVLALAGHPLVDSYDLSSLRALGVGAAPLGAEPEQRCAERLGCMTIQGYGMTEATALVATGPLHAPRRGSVGRLVPNTERGSSTPTAAPTSAPAAPGSCGCAAPRSCAATATAQRRPHKPSMATAGCTPATSATWTRTATCSWSTGSRS